MREIGGETGTGNRKMAGGGAGRAGGKHCRWLGRAILVRRKAKIFPYFSIQ
jgi:hypothetical protein